MVENKKIIPMIERWKNEQLIPEVIGYREISKKERIEARKGTHKFLISIGKMTQEQADKDLESLYDELDIPIAK